MQPERRLGEAGLREALDRLQAKPLDKSDYTHLIPFAEALSWVYALHEWHKRRIGGHKFFHLMRSTDDGQTLMAVAWARGSVQHELADVTKIVNVGTSEIGKAQVGIMVLGTLGYPTLRWAELSRLPSQFDSEGRHDYYRQHVAVRAVLEPLRCVQVLLEGLPI